MASNNPALNRALEEIFEKMATKKTTSVPPLEHAPTTLDTYFPPDEETLAARDRQRRTSTRNSGSTSNNPNPLQQHPTNRSTKPPQANRLAPLQRSSGGHGASAPARTGGAAGGRSNRSLRSTTSLSSSVAASNKKSSKNKNPKHTCGIHSDFCVACKETSDSREHKRFHDLLDYEIKGRMAVGAEEVDCFSAIIEVQWMKILGCRRRDQVERQKQREVEAAHQRRNDTMSEQMMQHVKAVRRQVSLEWEVGFDEIAAALKLSLRHTQQITDVMQRNAQNKQYQEEQEALRWEQHLISRHNERIEKERRLVENEESSGRAHITTTMSSVVNTVMNTFTTEKRRIMQHESRVQALLLRHSQKMSQLEAEKEKLASDEPVAREKLLNQERKAVDMMLNLEPEYRKRCQQNTAARLKREAKEQAALRDQEKDKRSSLESEETSSLNELRKVYNAQTEIVRKYDERRLLKQARREFRMDREEIEGKDMLASDNDSWRLERFFFEQAMDMSCIREEEEARRQLQQQKHAERTVLLNNERNRLRMEQAEARARSEHIREYDVANADIQRDMEETTDQFIMLWYEQIRRRVVEDELEDITKDLWNYVKELEKSAALLRAKQRSDVGVAHKAPDSGYSLWLKKSQVPWFFFAEAAPILEGCFVKDIASNEGVSSVTNVEFKCALLNPHEGDVITGVVASGGRVVTDWLVEITYTGSVSDLLESFVFRNTSLACSKTKLTPRIIEVSFDGITVEVEVLPQSPIVSPPEALVTSRTLIPLKTLVPPSRQEYKTMRCILRMPDSAPANGTNFDFTIPGDHFLNPKGGIQCNGKGVMRLNSSDNTHVDFEFDNLPSVNLRPLLNAMKVNRSEDLAPLDPLELEVRLTSREDDSLLVFIQNLDVDATLVDAPKLRVSSFDVALRATCSANVPEKLQEYIPANPQHIFNSAFLTFPEDQTDVIGGSIIVDLADHDEMTTIDIVGFDTQNVMVVEGPQLVCKYPDSVDEEELVLGRCLGHGTNSMTVQLLPTASVSTTMMNALLRSIVLSSNRRVQPTKAQTKAQTLQLALDVSRDARMEPLKVDFRVTVMGPAVEGKSTILSYKEGIGAKKFPNMDVRPSTLKLMPLARIDVNIIEGADPFADELLVIDSEYDPVEELQVFRHKSVPVAWWRRDESDKTKLRIFLTGGLKILEWMESYEGGPYPSENFNPDFKFDISLAAVNVLLKNIAYNCFNNNPSILKKKILVTVNDGRNGCSSIVFDTTIEAVDDPTEIVLPEKELDYRQLSLNTNTGFPLFSNVELDDPDSDNFHGGYVIAELANGPMDIGDNLYLLSDAQQELFIHQQQYNSSAVSCLTTLLMTAFEGGGAATEFAALSTVVDEEPVKLLRVSDGHLTYAGDQIGKITKKIAGVRENETVCSLRIDFRSETQFVSFAAATYVLRCFAYENLSPKMKPGPRGVNLRLNCTGLKTTTESIEKLVLTTHLALMSTSVPSRSLRYEEGAKPKQLLKQVVTALGQDVTLQHQGFFKASVRGAPGPSDELIFDNIGEIKVKEKAIFFGKDLVGVMQPRKPNEMYEVYVTFGKVTNQSLQAMLRALCFSNKSKDIEPEDRTVDVHCTADTEVEMCSLTLSLAISRKDDPTEIFLPNPRVVCMTASPAIQIAPGAQVTDADTKMLPSGTWLEASLLSLPRNGEFLCLCSVGSIEVSERGNRVEITTKDGVLLASVGKPWQFNEVNGAMYASPTLTVKFESNLVLDQIAQLIGTLFYANSLKGDIGTQKSVNITLKTGEAHSPAARATVAIVIAPSILDCSSTASTLHAQSGSGSLQIADNGRVQLLPLPMTSTFTVSVELATGFEQGKDTLSVNLSNEEATVLGLTLQQQDDSGAAESLANLTVPTKDKKDVIDVGVVEMKSSRVTLTASAKPGYNFSAVAQAFLRAVCITVDTSIAKDICADVKTSCDYGTSAEVIRIRC